MIEPPREVIIKDLIDTYSPGFTYANVADGITLPTIAFDRVPITEARKF